MSKEHAHAYEAGYRDGSINYELEHCPACKNVADLQEALAENAKLREEIEVTGLVAYMQGRKQLIAENAKLRELVRDMYGFIQRMDEDCGDVTFSDCFDYCKHDTEDDGCCKTGECWYEHRMRELGAEVTK